ncbi:MAG: GntR family transcriptional regulator [Eubacteriales bacterium]|nr:GntR family transcriptional regulator [Eubacteriales bacterium]MDD4104720.1 GntR family transcriptional regulator [Eubacteriales bacterium]MDD4710300.1 GntR family transcriptional regulator [Eubacteriales bacterium]NLO15291.1 GntR family transcriptional regulator [Clostridiales bacterium]
MADILAANDVAENKPIRDIAYETLKHAIIIGDIPAGTRIIETHYADKLHISRTPLREAMRQLELDGLVEYKERKGVIVSAFTIEDIEEIFTIRNALMMLIMPSIIENVTDEDIAALSAILDRMDVSQRNEDADALAQLNREFHRTMEHIARKVRILRVIDSQEEYIQRFAALSIASIVRRSHAHQEHHQMIDFLRARDLEGLCRLMRHHLDESKETCLNAVRSGKRLPKKT